MVVMELRFLSDVISVNPIPGNPIGLPHPAICSGESTNINVSENLLIAGTMFRMGSNCFK